MLTTIVPSYLYQEYIGTSPEGYGDNSSAIAGYAIAGYAIAGNLSTPAPVENLNAFFLAYNIISQKNLDVTNDLRLPIYTKFKGIYLDWVATGIYGLVRPSLGNAGTATYFGYYNTVPYDTSPYGVGVTSTPIVSYQVNDDYYKRILTWQFYKGDGFQFTTTWLKRRIKRFLYGINGIDFPIGDTYEISVEYGFPNTINITIPNIYDTSLVFQQGIQNGVLNVPFNYEFTVTY